MVFWIICHIKAIKEHIDEQPKIIKLFSINYARDLKSRLQAIGSKSSNLNDYFVGNQILHNL